MLLSAKTLVKMRVLAVYVQNSADLSDCWIQAHFHRCGLVATARGFVRRFNSFVTGQRTDPRMTELGVLDFYDSV
jgi:hypothetical protein